MMAALVQSFPSPSTSTMTMLQSRSTSSDGFQSSSQGQQSQRNSQTPRNIYNTSVGGMAAGTYRGQTSASPVSPYAFASTPNLQNGQNPLRQHPTVATHPRMEGRTSSAPSIPLQQQSANATASSRPRPPAMNAGSTPLNPSFSATPQSSSVPALQDTHPANYNSRPLSAIDLNTTPMSYASVAKSSPDRYRRNHQRAHTAGGLATNAVAPGGSAAPSGSGMATVGHLYNHPAQSSSSPALSSYRGATTSPHTYREQDLVNQPRLSSKDDMNLHRQPSTELAKRYRRRSISSLEAKEFGLPASEGPHTSSQPKTYAAMLAAPAPSERKDPRQTASIDRPTSSHSRSNNSETSTSSRAAPPLGSAKRGPEIKPKKEAPTAAPAPQQATTTGKNDAKTVNVPTRGSSEANKRLANPSPLSQPIPVSPEQHSSNGMPTESTINPSSAVAVGIPESPAAQQLAALNKKEGKKEGKSSRLRRAFSFGSAAELRKASAENSANNASTERARLRKSQYQDEEEAQQAAIAQQQEASGLGASIYSGQGNFFTGSTDNLSISSTASSASVMIRKMGKGVKKGSRSLVGLFRPKSIIGAPAMDPVVPEPTVAQVSMVTVEAEREKVNVNANPHDHAGGGTGFPKLERNSLDASSAAPSLAPAFNDKESVRGRQSIVGGEKERAEVLAAVKKGILKRTGTDSGNSSPVARPVDAKAQDPNLAVPRLNESPRSASPNRPANDSSKVGHRRTDSVHLEGEDYFMTLQNFANGDSNSVPGTPRSISRNISFSPRIIFHDTWPSGEYDRRGEIATCNRLTPMLAQQIKEELNTFKMEMEVHKESKVHTHFF